MSVLRTKDKTVLKTIGLMGGLGGSCEGVVDVKDGRIVRIRPLHYDWKYGREEVRTWKISRNGKTLDPGWKSLPPPFSLAYKKRVYSPNRIKYPLKRIDWDPNGERNTQNRGKSKYVRISWDEATDIIANEIRRIHKKYGVNGILMQGEGHAETKAIHRAHGHPGNLLEHMGGFTLGVRNPDSWEGWYWGAKHMWGQGANGYYFGPNVHKDVTEHAEMVLCWGCDPDTYSWGVSGQGNTRIANFWKEVGIKQVYINPDLNYGAGLRADKWIPVYPNTDAALQLAIAYIWITENTYNKEYVDTHVVGFDKFKAYVVGEEDGIPKTPKWASPKCGVPVWTIKALAREFARKTTSICHNGGGGMIRSAYSHEPARLEVCLLAMQGLGGPGVHVIHIGWIGLPRIEMAASSFLNPELPERLLNPAMSTIAPWQEQIIPKTLLHKAIESDEPITFTGSTAIEALVTDQFKKYTYPLPKEKGGSEIHMIWSDTPCRPTCWNAGHKTQQALRNPKIETIVTQHPWMENECCFSDIVLPISTFMEEQDLMNNITWGLPIPNVIYAEKAIEPIGESKSAFEAVVEVAKKLGMEEQVTEGYTNEDMIKLLYEILHVEERGSFENLKEKKYLLYNVAKDWEKDPPGFRLFYEDPERNPLPTPTGKLEFYSERLAQHFPDDLERPPSPKWIEKGPTHDDRRSSDRARVFPLLVVSNHPRWRMHAQCDDISWTREVFTCKVTGPDGYKYEPVWIHPEDAQKRGIKTGDIVKIFNELGVVLAGADVNERIMPGVIHIDHGARVDSIKPGEIDRGGAINLISPDKIVSQNCPGQATSSYLAQVERLSADEYERWRREYPKAFERDYEPNSGLQFCAWVERGKE
ncbi:MAG: molybdopterin-dependent oxidoreductase [Thermodesulfobacteriota bacterium]